MFASALISTLALALSVSASPIEKRACSTYVLINARGTFEQQGESIAVQPMNSQVHSRVPGGTTYNVVYPAGADQDSSAATTDIINQINNGLASCPGQVYILEGYSQGAAATVNAMSKLTGAAYDAVKGVVLLGNPFHKAGLNCNVDENGGSSTKNVNGISSYQGVYIPQTWVGKSRDICWKGDGICDTQNGGLNINHLQYPGSNAVQSSAADFIVAKLSS